jgi:hypothetical protein
VWKKLAGTAPVKVTDMIYVDTGQRDKWRGKLPQCVLFVTLFWRNSWRVHVISYTEAIKNYKS